MHWFDNEYALGRQMRHTRVLLARALIIKLWKKDLKEMETTIHLKDEDVIIKIYKIRATGRDSATIETSPTLHPFFVWQNYVSGGGLCSHKTPFSFYDVPSRLSSREHAETFHARAYCAPKDLS